MTVAEIREAQERVAPKDDLSPYVGMWVALRDGHVVASAVDAVTLRDDDAVRPDDVLMRVPSSSTGLYLL